MPVSTWPEVAALFEQGIAIPDDEKRTAMGEMRIRADRTDYRWSLFGYSDTELAIYATPSNNHLWRGINWPALVDLVRDYGAPIDQPP